VAARLRSVPVAFAAGIALGVVQNLVNRYAPDVLAEVSGFRSSIPFVLLFVLLFFVQGRGGRTAGSIVEEVPTADPREDLSPWRRRLPWAAGAIALLAYGFFVADAYWTGVLNRGLVLGLVFLSFVVVTGLGGMVNLAQATFVTVAGFTVGWLVNHQWPSTVPVLMNNGRLTFWMATIVAVIVAAVVGLLVALPSLRLGGLTLALSTLALAFVGDRLVFQLNGVRNGSKGWSIPRPAYGPVDLGDDNTLMVVLVVLLALVAGLIGNLQRSATGRAVLALRSSPVAAATSGLDPVRTKLVVFAVSAAIAGFAGAFFALVNSPMTNTSAPPLLGIVWLAVAVTFGIRRPGGAIVAGLVYSMFPVVLSGIGSNWEGAPWSSIPGSVRDLIAEPELASLLFGLGAVGLARQPDGLLADVGNLLRARRLSRPSRTGEPDVVKPSAASEASGPTEGGTAGSIRAGRPVDIPVGGDTSPLLVVADLHAGYGEVEVLHGVDLTVPAGGVVAVLGANGAGKSTLAGVLAGTVAATAGSVHLDGREVTADPPHLRSRAGLLLVPEARGVFPGLSVVDNLAVHLRDQGDRRAAGERFPILRDRWSQAAGLLSGGEQQLLSLAGALEEPPKVLVADEPSLGLAPMATSKVFEALAELRDLGCALVLVEEQAGGALELADTVVIMNLGRVAWSGPAAEVDLDRLGATYMGTGGPPTR
ncbi:MAG: ATP-binding cassette domain-containing protein, partial [Acidimicrobiales bacterium]|nr:ATP-binding cassette domain-containing protein [Acidimicrobiales bacterium]